MIPESAIKPVDELPTYESLTEENPALLKEAVMLKLNGGLGTGMGLSQAKSLLELKDGMTFLDFIALQVGHMREASGEQLAFMLMNSFSTSSDTLAYLSKCVPPLQPARLVSLVSKGSTNCRHGHRYARPRRTGTPTSQSAHSSSARTRRGCVNGL